MRRKLFWILGAGFLSSCVSSMRSNFYQINQEGEITSKALDRILWENNLGVGQPFSIKPLIESDLASYYLFQVRGSFEKRQHRFHDLALFVQQGVGAVYLDETVTRVQAGAVVFIPHGTTYALTSAGAEDLVALGAFSPRFNEQDTILNPPAKLYPKALKEEKEIRKKMRR
jgi:mannose-6-phosphate isomerase-like protein (cupin superfamily)